MSARPGLVAKKSSWPLLGHSRPFFLGAGKMNNKCMLAYFPWWAHGPKKCNHMHVCLFSLVGPWALFTRFGPFHQLTTLTVVCTASGVASNFDWVLLLKSPDGSHSGADSQERGDKVQSVSLSKHRLSGSLPSSLAHLSIGTQGVAKKRRRGPN